MSWPRPPFFFPTSFSLRKREDVKKCKLVTRHIIHPPFQTRQKSFGDSHTKSVPSSRHKKRLSCLIGQFLSVTQGHLEKRLLRRRPPFPPKIQILRPKSQITTQKRTPSRKNCDFNCIISNLLHNRLHFPRKVQSSPLSVLLCLDIVDKTRCVAPAVALAAPLLPSLPLVAPLQRLLHLPPGHHT